MAEHAAGNSFLPFDTFPLEAPHQMRDAVSFKWRCCYALRRFTAALLYGLSLRAFNIKNRLKLSPACAGEKQRSFTIYFYLAREFSQLNVLW